MQENFLKNASGKEGLRKSASGKEGSWKNASGKEDFWKNASGKVDYNMLNDYLFRAVLQSNKTVLKGLIASLLHMPPKKIRNLKIMNPIILGESIDSKEFRLDILVSMKSGTMNLEMQVINYDDWPERSLSYLCREFDKLYHGEDYSDATSAIHVGFLDFTLFPNHPSFYSTYKMVDVKNTENLHVFSDKFVLGVVNLRQTELATEEDRFYGIDRWAKLFRAKTWEEIRMVVEKSKKELSKEKETEKKLSGAEEPKNKLSGVEDEVLTHFKKDEDLERQIDACLMAAAESMYKLNADYNVRKRCQDREDYYRDIRNFKKEIEDQKKKISEMKKENSEKKKEIFEMKKENSEKKREISEMKKEISAKDQELLSQRKEIDMLRKQLEKLTDKTV